MFLKLYMYRNMYKFYLFNKFYLKIFLSLKNFLKFLKDFIFKINYSDIDENFIFELTI